MSDGFAPEDVPDSDTGAPHHAYIGGMGQVLGVAVMWFSFEYVWGTGYSVVGALLTLAGVGVSGLGLLVTLDDVVEHSFDVPTPLDELWTRWLAPAVHRLDRRNEGDG